MHDLAGLAFEAFASVIFCCGALLAGGATSVALVHLAITVRDRLSGTKGAGR